MTKIIKIYCEGRAGSIDFDLLQLITDGLSVQTIPIGGKTGAKSAIQVHEAGLSKADFKIFFRDRDFDAPVPAQAQLIHDGTYVYYSYRTTIENYLLDYSLIEAYTKSQALDANDLRKNYHDAAKNIRYFQALRHTLGELRTPTDFGTNITEKSGTLPTDLSETYCRSMGYEKIKASLAKTESWNRANYDSTYDKFVALFDDDFIESDKFLIYFQGKDFMKSLSRKLPDFSPKNYYRFAKSKFDYRTHPDLMELRKLLENQM